MYCPHTKQKSAKLPDQIESDFPCKIMLEIHMGLLFSFAITIPVLFNKVWGKFYSSATPQEICCKIWLQLRSSGLGFKSKLLTSDPPLLPPYPMISILFCNFLILLYCFDQVIHFWPFRHLLVHSWKYLFQKWYVV
jgi:hypothetical protein